MTGLGALAQLDLDHPDLLGLGFLRESDRIEIAVSRPASEIAASDFPDEIALGEIAARVHDLSHELHPSTAATLGLVPALRGVCREMSGRHGITVDFRHDDVPPLLDAASSLALFRIAQAALHNVIRHSGAGRALVELRRLDEALELAVTDEGCGFDAGAPAISGLGLVSMRERARLLDGECRITTAPGRGTRVAVSLPLTASTVA